jgi:hypothetical protein
MEWLSKVVPGSAPDGSPILSVLGKQTYNFVDGGTAQYDDNEQIPLVEADEFFGENNPASDATKYESDLVAYKPMTDVVLVGKAHAPKGKKILQFNVGLQVGAARKIIQVSGDRKVYVTGTGFAFSEPKPFDEMPLDYSRAYGGKDDKSEEGSLYTYLRNPVGKGFIVKNNTKALQDLELPNLEPPEKLLTPKNLVLGKFEQWKVYPEPASFGYMGKSFYPRFTLAGLPPDSHADAEVDRQKTLQKQPEVGTPGSQQPQPVMPMLNLEFFNGASPGLRLPYLVGDEALMLANLDADHPRFTFKLPGVKPKAWLDVGQGRETMPMVPHTVLVFKETNQLTMVWRGCVKYGGPASMEKFTAFEFGVES